MIIPAFAIEAADNTAPATANLILLFIKISYVKKYLSNLVERKFANFLSTRCERYFLT
jgi:hypothetical protein